MPSTLCICIERYPVPIGLAPGRVAEKLSTGRPRLIALDGKERLLDDELTEALPVWSPDASKVATGFDTDLRVYDAAGDKPTQARIRFARCFDGGFENF